MQPRLDVFSDRITKLRRRRSLEKRSIRSPFLLLQSDCSDNVMLKLLIFPPVPLIPSRTLASLFIACVAGSCNTRKKCFNACNAMLGERGSREFVHWLRYTTMAARGGPARPLGSGFSMVAVSTEVVLSALVVVAERTGRIVVGSGARYLVAVLGRTPVVFGTPNLGFRRTLFDRYNPYQE